MTERKTYSISVRLRRTVTEEAFVSVPLDAEITDPTPDKGGQFHVDGNKLMKAAVRLGYGPRYAVVPGTRTDRRTSPNSESPSSKPASK